MQIGSIANSSELEKRCDALRSDGIYAGAVSNSGIPGPRRTIKDLLAFPKRYPLAYRWMNRLEVLSDIGEGTTVTMRIPLRKRLGVNLESPRAITSEVSELSPS